MWAPLCVSASKCVDQQQSIREIKAKNFVKTGVLVDGLAPLSGSQVPSVFLSQFGKPESFIRNWTSWCLYRGVDLDSPAPLVLHSALTVFHAVRLAVPKIFSLADRPKVLTVHLVGVEREVFEISTFAELAALLPSDVSLRLHLIGPGVKSSHDGLSVVLHRAQGSADAVALVRKCSSYEKFASAKDFVQPDLFVALNAGLMAPHPHFEFFHALPWQSTIDMLIERRMSAVFTDYMRQSCSLPLSFYSPTVLEKGGSIIEASLNPFREPLARHFEKHYAIGDPDLHPSFANGFIFGWHFHPN